MKQGLYSRLCMYCSLVSIIPTYCVSNKCGVVPRNYFVSFKVHSLFLPTVVKQAIDDVITTDLFFRRDIFS
jgi:hypothetical protein